MNGSKSPGPTTRSSAAGDAKDDAPGSTNGHTGASSSSEKNAQASPVPSIEGNDGARPDAPSSIPADAPTMTNGADEDASEAETLIDSPVKRREAEKRQNVSSATSNGTVTTVKSERAQKSRIGSLPVPHDDDDEMDSGASPMQSTEVSVGAAASSGDAKDEDAEMLDDDADAEGSDVLSSAQSSANESRESSPSRAVSENPEATRKDDSPPNPRKRKHRASSVDNLPSKRRSMDPPARRRLRGGMHAEDGRSHADRSPSPKARGHRRAVSTQSAIDSSTADGVGRKRRGSHFPPREPKSARGWEESDASSETTSRGNDDYKRPQRGVGRSTSTPGGRTAGREHKRHVNKYGFTKLAEACEDGDLDSVKEWREKDPESLELAEFAGNKPLQIAALNGNAEVVSYLISEGAQTDCANVDKDTPLIDAAENGHLDVVRLLLEAGVDPLRQNNKGQQALDVVTDATDDATGIRSALHAAIEDWTSKSAQERREEEEERHSRAVTSKELHFMARTYENLLKLVQNNDRTGVQEFLAARVPVDNIVIAAAAKTGDVYLVNMLLAEMTEKKLLQKAEKPMLAVLGSSHFEMVKVLTELEWFDPLRRDRQGKTWAELAEEKQGPMWRQEKDLLLGLFERAGGTKVRRSSSPVSKRDAGSRRKIAQQKAIDEESDDDDDDAASASASADLAKKKTPRRLMSKKDLRTAKGGGGTVTDDSGPASSEEDAPGEPDEVETKPPETPSTGTRRRLRSKSHSGSPEMTPKSLRKKRSMSFRGPTGSTMPTLNEEEHDASSGVDGGEQAADTISVEAGRKDREEDAKAALESAKQAEEKRKQEVAAEAEAKKVQEEAKRQAEEEKRLENERKAEEARKAELARQAEEARKEEEERQQLRQAQEEEKLRYRSEVLTALPAAFQTPLHPDTPVHTLESISAKCWLELHCSPLRILPTRDQHLWILNLQAAPLLGADGLELFFSSDYLDYDNCRAAQWATSDLAESDKLEVDLFLARLPQYFNGEDNGEANTDTDDLPFLEVLQHAAERFNAYNQTRRRLLSPNCKAKLRRVRLQDVVNNLHPSLRSTGWEVEFADPRMRYREEVLKQLEIQGTQDFVGRMKVFWEGSRVPYAVSAGQNIASAGSANEGGHVRLTDAVVRHEK